MSTLANYQELIDPLAERRLGVERKRASELGTFQPDSRDEHGQVAAQR